MYFPLTHIKNLLFEYKAIIIGIFLIVSTSIVYWQLGGHEFINFDDTLYVTENPQVKSGITMEGITWAFGFTDRAYWHPITWLSHMLDCELFGEAPGMHHLMNLFFHLLNSLLLFTVLKSMTGSYWRSGFVAALFALHPVNVDTVAWISERKNLISTFFWLLTMLAYTGYVRKPNVYRYLAVLCFFMLGLLSKPMLITLPFVLLLLDYWPLGRIQLFVSPDSSQGKDTKAWKNNKAVFLKIVLEKIPFFILAVFMIVLSITSFRHHSDVISTDVVSIQIRLANALVSYVHYILKMIWPSNLTIYYPFPLHISMIEISVTGIILISVSSFFILKARSCPYCIVGWLWYLGTLVPVSGIVQAGLWPAMAERWAYVPFIGLFIIVSWGSYDLYSRIFNRKIVFGVSLFIILTFLGVLAWKQTACWENDYKLFSHAIQVNDKNSIAYSNLADVFFKEGDFDNALLNYSKSVSLNPNDLTTRNNYAIALLRDGKFNESVEHFQAVLKRLPDDEQLYIGLGIAFTKLGEYFEAIKSLTGALRVNPENPETHFQIAVLFGETGNIDEAIFHYRKALRISPDYTDARNNLRIVTDRKNRIERAIQVLQEQIEIDAENTIILQKLAALHSQKADYGKAHDYLERIVRIQPENADGYYNIACVYARQGEVEKSIQWLNKAFEKGFSDHELLKTDKDLDNVRHSENFKKLINDKAQDAGH